MQRSLLMLTDTLVSDVSLFLSVFLYGLSFEGLSVSALWYLAVSLIFIPMSEYVFGTYRIAWRHSGVRDVVNLVVSVGVGCAVSLAATMVIARSLYLFLPIEIICTLLLSACLSVTVRMTFRHLLLKSKRFRTSEAMRKTGSIKDYGRTMIIGGGRSAEILLREMPSNAAFSSCTPVAVIDDNPALHGCLLRGIPIMGGRDSIVNVAKAKSIKTIFFAITSATREDRRDILKICSSTGCNVLVMNAVDKFTKSSDVTAMRKVNISDLLGREMISIDVDSIAGYVENKTVMVTGGGGSIGSELCRQIAGHRPKKLIIFDIYENSTYDILNELRRGYPELDLDAVIGSVRDEKRLNSVFETYRPDIVYHAAAHKHVPLMEDSPHEAVKNNIFGTLNAVRAADRYGVSKFVMISTDKAVNPTNVMGATKRVCEMIIQTYNNKSNTEYVAVRFGNVLGSNGSVVPLFERQIKEGGPVTVTHPDIIRYFMTIPEAVSLVLSAGAFAKGGEVFVLDMGEPVKILDLAENMIRLSGYEPYQDIDIKFTGLRPGEKLYEELLMDEEGLSKTQNSLIYVGKPMEIDEEQFFKELEELHRVVFDGSSDIRELLRRIVPTFKERK